MNARRDSPDEPVRGSVGGRVLLGGAVVFALAATGVLILTDEQRWLRLGIVAALWAALVGAFVAARYRRQVVDQEDVLAERQERYELELEKEIAARREYELEVAAEARRQADENARGDIAALRQELTGLRQTLESLLGGEFLVERYALRAESTRMRSLPDDRSLKRLPPATFEEAQIVQEEQTDLIERVREGHQAPKRPATPSVVESRSQPWQQAHPAEVSDRWFVPDGLGTDAAASAQSYGARRYAQQQTQYVAGPGAGNRHNAVASGYVEPVRRAHQNGSGQVPPGETARPAQSSGYGGRAEASGYGPSVGRAEASGYRPSVGRAESSGYVSPAGRAEPSPYGAPARRAEASGYGPAVGRAEASGYGPPASRAEASGYGPPAGRPEASRYGAQAAYPSPTSRAEASGYSPPVNQPETGGGRRRRAEGQPTWQESRQNGANRQPEAEPSGSHAAGRSVSELLASHGGARPTNPRRRRRKD